MDRYSQLINAEQRFREFAQTVPDVFWVHDVSNGISLYVSPNFERLWGRPCQEMYDNPNCWLEAIHPDDRDGVRRQWARILESRGKVKYDAEYRIVRPDGTIRWIHDRGASTLDASGSPCRMLGIAEDITTRKVAEQERAIAEDETRTQQAQRLESLEVLAGGIAHDFNNLLVTILGNSDLTLNHLPQDSPVREYVETIVHAGRQAAELCSQMVAYAGKGRFIVKPVQLNDIVREIAQILRVSIPKRITHAFDLAPDLPPFEGDPTQIRQVLMNLMTNAAESIGEDAGQISITTRLVRLDAERVSEMDPLALQRIASAGDTTMNTHAEHQPQMEGEGELRPGDYACVEITDTGCGMDRHVRDRIFEPFFTTKFTGRGLGMAAVLGIVRVHNGTIRVSSETGQGSTFTLYFPISPADAGPGVSARRRDTADRPVTKS